MNYVPIYSTENGHNQLVPLFWESIEKERDKVRLFTDPKDAKVTPITIAGNLTIGDQKYKAPIIIHPQDGIEVIGTWVRI